MFFWERGVTAFLTELLFYDPSGHLVICLLSSSFMTLFLSACLQGLTIIWLIVVSGCLCYFAGLNNSPPRPVGSDKSGK